MNNLTLVNRNLVSRCMSWICQSTTSSRRAAPAGLANPAEEISQDKFNKALQSNHVLIYQSQDKKHLRNLPQIPSFHKRRDKVTRGESERFTLYVVHLRFTCDRFVHHNHALVFELSHCRKD